MKYPLYLGDQFKIRTFTNQFPMELPNIYQPIYHPFTNLFPNHLPTIYQPFTNPCLVQRAQTDLTLSKALLVGLVADPRELGGCAQRLSPIIFVAMASTATQ